MFPDFRVLSSALRKEGLLRHEVPRPVLHLDFVFVDGEEAPATWHAQKYEGHCQIRIYGDSLRHSWSSFSLRTDNRFVLTHTRSTRGLLVEGREIWKLLQDTLGDGKGKAVTFFL